MSEGLNVEEHLAPDEVPDLATTYLEASEEEPEHQKRIQSLETEIDELESTREEVVTDVGDDHYLVEDIESEIGKLEDERNDILESTEDIAELRENLLQAAAEEPGFRLNENWLNSKTIQALTHILYDSEDEKLVIADEELRTPDDAQELDRIKKITVKREIVHLARDLLEGDERVANRWEEFEDSRAYQAFPVIASDPGVGPSEIAEAYDKSSSTVRNWTSDLSDQDELKMVYTPSQGAYHLSTVGKYYAQHYEDLDEGAVDGEDEDGATAGVDQDKTPSESSTTNGEDQNDDTGSEQVGLGNSDDEERGASGADLSVDLSEAETTEEKAEALFDEVSDTRDN